MKLAYVFALLLTTTTTLAQDDNPPEGTPADTDADDSQSSDTTDDDSSDTPPSDSTDDNGDVISEDDISDTDTNSNPDDPVLPDGLVGGPWVESKISAIDREIRYSWCRDQVSICANQCRETGSGPNEPTCNVRDLSWTCRCNDGSAPDLDKVDLTIPFFQCQYDWEECHQSCTAGDQPCSDNCSETFQCGAQGIQSVENSETQDSDDDDDESNRSGAGDDGTTEVTFGSDAEVVSVGLGIMVAMLVGVW